jgi:RNA polymerase sigma-70 factor, ECF subfamily
MVDVAVWSQRPVIPRGRRSGVLSHMESDIENDRDTDETLLQKVAGGDERAFSELYDRFSAPLFGLMRQMLDDVHEAEDLLQDGFVNLWDKAANYDPTKGKAFSWAVMIFRNKAIDRLRARGRRARLTERAAEEPELWTREATQRADDAADDMDRASMVRKAMVALPKEQRKLIELAFLKGLTHHGIAESLGLPLGTVKTSIRRGLLRLRELMKRGAQ